MEDPTSFSRGRKWRIALQVAVGIVSFIALVIMFNYLSARHHTRYHWSARTDVELTPRTLTLLRAMTNEVDVTVFFAKESELYGPVTRLLEEYEAQCPSLNVRLIDIYRNPLGAQKVKAEYKIDSDIDDNLVIVAHQDRIQVLPAKSLADFEYEQYANATEQGYRKHYRSFQGELLFTSAIADVISPRQVRAYFLQGHDEHNPGSTEAQMGYAGFNGLLRENNIQLVPLNLGQSDIPVDCDLLILTGPQKALHPTELDRIEQYLNQGGRMLVGFNFRAARVLTGLESLLGQWGVVVGMNLIVDEARQVGGDGQATARYGSHPIVGPLRGVDLMTVYPRTVAELKGGNPGHVGATITELVFTGTNAVVYTEFENNLPKRTGAEAVTEFPIAVAVQKGGVPGIASDRGGVTRIVVMGDSHMFSNLLLNQKANRDFANQIINWLVDRTELMSGIGPRPMQEYQLALMPAQLRTVRFILIAGLPSAALFVGFLVWLRRRN